MPLIFYSTAAGSEPVREWLKGLVESERQEIGRDLPTKRTARVLICLHQAHLIALHGFIKKTRGTPDEDLAISRKRQKDLAGRS